MDFVKLKMLCEFEKGSTGLAKAEPGEYPLVATGAKRKTCNTFQFDTKAVCIPLVSSTGHGHASLKNVHYQEGMFALGSILVALTSKDGNKLDIQFLHLYLSQLKDEVLVPLMSGAANVALSVKKIQDIEIPLPSIERQREIVERFKSIVREEDELKTELSHQQTLLKKLRQQILQDAIEGKLTADWRGQNPDIEPASELLKRIAAEKEQLVKDKKIKAQKPLSPITDEEKPFELPQGWEWCRLLDLCSKTGSGSTPSGGKSAYVDFGVKFIRSQNVYNDGFRWNGEAYISKLIHRKMNGTSLAPKDLLLNITGGSIGRCCILPVSFDEGNINQHVAILRLVFPEQGEFLHSLVCSAYFQSEIIKSQTGAGREGLPKNKMDNILVPFPSFLEQKAIETKVEKLLALCDQLEIQITQNQTHANQLMQAVLKEAFSYTPKVEKSVDVQPPNNILPFKPKGADYYKRTLLAAEIVHQLHKEPTLGHLKLQKLIYLCQKTESMQLPTQFLKQVAGPYDNRMARSIDKQLKDKKWFSYNRDQVPKYTQLEKAGQHQTDFDKYFAQQKDGIHALIRLFRKAKSDQLEIVATLYACWEGILMKQEPLSEDLLVQRFYEWSEEKSKYEAPRIHKAIEWMRNKNIVPDPEKIAHA